MVSEDDKEGGMVLNRNARRCIRMCVGEENELRGVCVCVRGNMKGEKEQKDLVDVLCEWFSGDNVAVCRPLTCSISQSDLQRRERDEPTELKWIRISVRMGWTMVRLVITEKKNATFHTKDTWHVRVNECNRYNAYHLLLQLVVFPVDQYHRFLEHWWERTHQGLSFACECLLGKTD